MLGRSWLLLVAALSTAGASTALAQSGNIVLRLADYLPPAHVIRENLTKPYMAAVTKATNGRVTFQDFPGEQLGKAQDMLTLTLSGVADIGYVVPTLISDKMPLAGVGDLPGAFKTSCEGSLAYLKLTKDGGFLEKAEYTPTGIKLLAVLFLPPYQLVLGSSKPFASLADISGLKVRTAGGSVDLAVRSLGAVPVRMSAPAVHESMMRGTIDGVLFSYQSVVSYDLTSMVKSGLLGENFGTPVATYSISLNKWKQLPPDVQKVLETEGENITRKACEIFAQEELKAQEKIRATGAKLITFNEADQKKLAETFATVRSEWSKEMERRGKPGAEALKAFDAARAAPN